MSGRSDRFRLLDARAEDLTHSQNGGQGGPGGCFRLRGAEAAHVHREHNAEKLIQTQIGKFGDARPI